VNTPDGIPRLGPGDEIKFKRDHVIDIHWHDWDPGEEEPHPSRAVRGECAALTAVSRS
jgi:hypothetical protein